MSTTATTERLLLRPAEAAEVIGVSRGRMYELLAKGEIPSIRLGGPAGSIRVPVAELREWVDAQIAARKETTAAA